MLEGAKFEAKGRE